MNEIVQFIVKHGYGILFGTIFARQIGLPVPAPLFLLAAGAVAAARRLILIIVIALAVIASVLADWPWYEAGRRNGIKVLHFDHRLYRDPEYHDRKAQETFDRYSPSILHISKFVPGLDAVAPPLAGISRTKPIRFLAFDGIGASLYSCTYTGIGYLFSHRLDLAAAYIGRAGSIMASLALAGIAVFLLRALIRRHRSVRECEATSIAPGNSNSDVKLQLRQCGGGHGSLGPGSLL